MPGFARPVAGALYTKADGTGRAGRGGARHCARRPPGARRHGADRLRRPRRGDRRAAAISAFVTEQGPIACRAVVLAGGAWSRLFCGNMGLDPPQLKVLGSAAADSTGRRPPPKARRRWLRLRLPQALDGGYKVSLLYGGLSTAEITPSSPRRRSSPPRAAEPEWKHLKMHVGRLFLNEPKGAWRPLGGRRVVSPFEQDPRARTRNPITNSFWTQRWPACARCIPDLQRKPVESSAWAGSST